MDLALALAQRAADHAEVPVGAVVVMEGRVIGEGWNQPVAANDASAHAEIVALRAAGAARQNYRLGGATLFVTLEPCVMCIGAILNARVSRLVFGAWDLKAGACGSVIDIPREARLTRGLDVFGGVCSEQCSALLKDFFAARR